MSYTFHLGKHRETFDELEPFYRKHYGEMVERLAKDGITYPPYNPRWDEYWRASDRGRVAKLWKRMGFKESATQMIYTF